MSNMSSQSLQDLVFLGDIETLKKSLNNENYDAIELRKNNNLLHIAASLDEIEIFKLLFTFNPSKLLLKNSDNHTPLHTACVNNSVMTIKFILSIWNNSVTVQAFDFPDLNTYLECKSNWDENCLHLAVISSDSDIIDLLVLTNGKLIHVKDKWGRYPFDIAFEFSRPDSILSKLRIHLDYRLHTCNIDLTNADIVPKKSIIQNCIVDELFTVLKLKQQRNLCPEVSNEITVKNMYSESRENLVSTGNAKVDSHITPVVKRISLSQKIEYPGDIESIKSMLHNPLIDIKGKDMYGLTSLHKLSSWNRVELLDLLLPLLGYSDINYQVSSVSKENNKGFTALHFCVEMNAENSLRRLLQCSEVDTGIKDGNNRTARDYACELKLANIIDVFDQS